MSESFTPCRSNQDRVINWNDDDEWEDETSRRILQDFNMVKIESRPQTEYKACSIDW